MNADLNYSMQEGNRWYRGFGWLLGAAIAVNAGALFIPILEPDGALYATIARSMAQAGNFIELRVEGRDWLDKPHFPFWLAALSFRFLGVNAFAYKLPALLFWAVGGYYTRRLAFVLYGRQVSGLALLIYVSSAHLVISNNDVRAEPYLTGLVAGAVYHFYRASRDGKGKSGAHLIIGSALAACAVMTKGPFVLVTIWAGLFLDWGRTRDWRQFLQPRWWVALVLIALFITPELYCLYRQFDMHPEKIIFGHQRVSGIRWFLWDSQFGRFMNNGPIRGSGNPFFFFHTVLWAFLPWSVLLYAAVTRKCSKWRFANPTIVPGDILCLGSALVSFAMFSLSRFQLPHYLNILFPFFSILTAEYLYCIDSQIIHRVFARIQNGMALLIALLTGGLAWWFHFSAYGGLTALVLALAGIAAFLVSPAMRLGKGAKGKLQIAILRSFWIALIAYAVLNFCLYPAMMRYQAGMEAGGSLHRGDTIPQSVYMLREAPSNYSFSFYCPGVIRYVSIDSLRFVQDTCTVWVFLSSPYSDTLRLKGYNIQTLRRFLNFHISALTPEFIDWRTRRQALDTWLLIKVRDRLEKMSNGPVPK